MEAKRRHELFWAFAQYIEKPLLKYLFNFEADPIEYEGPALIICNHSNDYDPLLVAQVFPKNMMYYVASEHIFRWGIVSKIIRYLVDPIPRKKASSGADTVKMCLRSLKAGNSVCLFAEGEATWDGRSIDAFSATGKLAKSSGASLITVKITGAYLSNPRWSHTNRKGKAYGRVINVYSPEKLSEMSAPDILAAINKDIYEDCWQRQKDYAVKFIGEKKAEHIEKAVYICPSCKSVGTIKSVGDSFTCTKCNNGSSITEFGTFADGFQFENIALWDEWQKEVLMKDDFVHESDEVLFSDEKMTLTQILSGHDEKIIGTGYKTCQYRDKLTCGICTFNMKDISNMSVVQAKRLLFSYKGNYYEIKAEDITSVRKYLEFWKNKSWEGE